MFKKILVANRGEIACRVFRTARRLGIATVAVFSDADRGAPHAEMADEAIGIGPPPAAESYLSIAAIVDACRRTGADAVHPGYGFLSENPAFVRALEAAGIAFIGPSADAIEAMGDKIAAKKIAARAGVATVPGHLGTVSDADEAVRIAGSIGYPVMLKASAGGGGKGMRVAATERELRESFPLAGSEARSAFGDDRLFIERFIEGPRHIEIQVLADGHGNAIHLGERECSIQRRNQKVVEEAPSTFLDDPTRAAMGAEAVALAKAVGYRSAGTVEFIVDRGRNFYFLEMNTRLQVEHPVTELVTGVDLVEEMIRIAAGERLRLSQGDVGINGWAIEARIYAEDASRDFLPSVGRLSYYRPPPEETGPGAAVRIDSGIVEGSEISLYYDPLIAKLCTWAPRRNGAIDAMADALDAFTLVGIRHNIPFLAALMQHPRWRDGDLSTGFIAEEYPAGFHAAAPSADEARSLAAIVLSAALIERRRNEGITGAVSHPSAAAPSDWVVALDRLHLPVRLIGSEVAGGVVRLEAAIADAPAVRIETGWRPGENLWRGSIDGRPALAQIRREGHALRVSRRGASAVARLLTPAAAAHAALMPAKVDADRPRALLCPMPGLVVSIAVSEGQRVQGGETLAIVEAMKMENVLRAERAAMVGRIVAKAGDILAVDDVILEFA